MSEIVQSQFVRAELYLTFVYKEQIDILTELNKMHKQGGYVFETFRNIWTPFSLHTSYSWRKLAG